MQTLNLEWKLDNFGMVNSSWKCTIGNKIDMIFQSANPKTMLETF